MLDVDAGSDFKPVVGEPLGGFGNVTAADYNNLTRTQVVQAQSAFVNAGYAPPSEEIISEFYGYVATQDYETIGAWLYPDLATSTNERVAAARETIATFGKDPNDPVLLQYLLGALAAGDKQSARAMLEAE